MVSTAIKRKIMKKFYCKSRLYWCPYCLAEFTVDEPCYHFVGKDKKNEYVYLSLYENRATMEAVRNMIDEVNSRGYYRA